MRDQDFNIMAQNQYFKSKNLLSLLLNQLFYLFYSATYRFCFHFELFLQIPVLHFSGIGRRNCSVSEWETVKSQPEASEQEFAVEELILHPRYSRMSHLSLMVIILHWYL